MVCQHHIRDVCLIVCTLPWLCTTGHGAEDTARAIITDVRRGNCIICHVIPVAGLSDNDAGNLGPSLAGVGSRLTPAQIRARIVDSRQLSPDTVMPAYGSTSRLYRVQAAYRGKTILTDAEIDEVVTYLSALK